MLVNFQIAPASSFLLCGCCRLPVLLALGLLVGFSQWEAPLGDERVGGGRGWGISLLDALP